MSKLNVLILFGGYSTEHEVSIKSARNVIEALDRNKFNPILVAISKDSGTWYHLPQGSIPSDVTAVTDTTFSADHIANLQKDATHVRLRTLNGSINHPVEFVMPVLHGKYGEDGCLQGLCRMLGLPFSGPAVASSAVCMDKDFTKRILENAGVPIGPYLTVYPGDKITYDEVKAKLGPTLFIKPANTGSSVGVYKIKSQQDFDKYVPIVFNYDDKIVLEQFIPCREIECAVLGNLTPTVSILGEITPKLDFYSYEAKYLDPNGADLTIPAQLPETVAANVQAYAKQAYKVMGCKGLSRIDFFVTPDHQIYLNEINTLPGFTNISMYPKLFEASGKDYTSLITSIIELGLDDFNTWQNFTTEHQLG